MSSLKSYLLSHVSSETYYRARFPKWNPALRQNQLCPWHNDTEPSLAINLNAGGARCHACNQRLGNIVHFESERLRITEDAACTAIYSELVRPIVPDSLLAPLQVALEKSPKIAKILLADCGITRTGIDMFALGWNAVSQRLVIPIFDRWGQIVNLRLYRPPRFRSKSDENYKVINLITDKDTPKEKRFGRLDLFSWPHFETFELDKPIFIMPSEKEMILGMQEGLQCLCATAGEQAWSPEWNEWLMGYDICVVAQRDKVGREAAARRLATVQTVANWACVLEPPTEQKDFADYIVKDEGQGMHMLAAFREAQAEAGRINAGGPRKIVKKTHPFWGKRPDPSLSGTPPSEPALPHNATSPPLPQEFSPRPVRLVDVGHAPEMLNLVVHTTGIVAAKSTRTYTIPWRFKIKSKGKAQKYYMVPMGRTLMSFIDATDNQIKKGMRDLLDLDDAEIEFESYITAAEVEVIPTAAVNEDVPYVTQRCYYIGSRIEANIPYDLSIIPTTSSDSQETVGLIVAAVAIARAVETATFNEEQLASLQIFKPQGAESVWEALQSRAEELSQHYTKIYNRPDWHLVALMTWLSPIGWMFPYEEEIQRGWLNSLVIGDTQTGKSKVTQTYQRLFRSGSIINAENCTYVGLVGGAVKMGSGQFMLRWGRIPLCDKQLVVIEELSGLSIEEISNMSDVRSSGIARLDKGGLSAETNARTRLLALSNPRPINKNLAGYLSGVRAVQELIGHGEDIARFDLISTLVDREVSVEVINRPFSSLGDDAATSPELYQRLCQFIWALKPEQIKITTDAYLACLEETKRLSDIYHPSIPVFKGGSGRYKLARVAATIACLQFSWTGSSILVLEDHVDAAAKFLQSLYDKPSFGYDEWSRQMFDRDGIKDIATLDAKLIEVLRSAVIRGKVMEALMHASKFTRDELCAIASLQISTADSWIGVMFRERVLRKGEANVWEVTPAGRDWMKTHLKDDVMMNNGHRKGKTGHEWFNTRR